MNLLTTSIYRSRGDVGSTDYVRGAPTEFLTLAFTGTHQANYWTHDVTGQVYTIENQSAY